MPGPVNDTTVSTSDNTGHQQHLASGGFYGGFSTIASLYNQRVINEENDRRYEKSVRDNRRNADVAFRRQQALQKEAEDYNSYQNKVRMLRQAGLNPALAYGDLSSSVSAGSADQAAPGSPIPAQASADFSGMQQIPQAINTMYDTQQKAITNKYLDTKNTQEIFRMIAETQKMLADTTLTEEQRENLIAFRSQQLDLLKAQTDAQIASAKQSEATAEFTSGANTELAKANASNAAASAAFTSGVGTDKARQDIATSKSQASLNRANTSYTKEKERTEVEYNRDLIASKTLLNDAVNKVNQEQAHALERDNNLSDDQKNAISKWMREHGYSKGLDKFVYKAFESAPEHTTKSISSWLDAGNWLPFVSNLIRTFSWKKSAKESSNSYNSFDQLKHNDGSADIMSDEPHSGYDKFSEDGMDPFSYKDTPRSYEETHRRAYDILCERPVYTGRDDVDKEEYDRRCKELDKFFKEFNASSNIRDSERPRILGSLYSILQSSKDSKHEWETFKEWVDMLNHQYETSFKVN